MNAMLLLAQVAGADRFYCGRQSGINSGSWS